MATAENKLQNASVISDPLHQALRNQLEYRRQVLSEAATRTESSEMARLLREVDGALNRLETGAYGICELCHEPVEDEHLLQDPLVRFCFGHMQPDEQRALERDLELAAQIQARLLPKRDFRADGWHVAYHYKPVGIVSGDYCDLVAGPGESLYFMLGDVSGKGVAASMLMSNLSAIFRTLIPLGLPLSQLMDRANHVFSGSTLPTQFATLVCGRAARDGKLEVCNAGHLAPLVVTRDRIHRVESHCLPIGLFADQTFTTSWYEVGEGDSLVLFSDGISEAHNGEFEYGESRIVDAIRNCAALTPEEAVAACVQDLVGFLGQAKAFDDQALMIVQRHAPESVRPQ